MKDYYNVQPDNIYLLNKHFTKGRQAKIEYVTRHHLAMVGDVKDVVDRVWNTRQASAHYVVAPNGSVGQSVYDGNTAWSNANTASNARSISIEHSNSAGASADWPISEQTIISGARLAAALCLFYKLGRPVFGKNIRDHREFGQTSCPYHLANGGKYHQQWMNEAQRFYDALARQEVNPDGSQKTNTATKETDAMNDEQSQKLNRVHHELTHEFQSRYTDADNNRSSFRDTAIGYALENDAKLTRLTDDILPRVEEKLDTIIRHLTK
jgi:hypothetical protein